MTTTSLLKIFAISIFAPFTTSLLTSSEVFKFKYWRGRSLHFTFLIEFNYILSKVWTFFCGFQNIVNRIIRQRKSKCGICKGNDFAIADIGEILLDLQKSYFSNFQWTILVSIIFRAILISLAFMYTLRRLKYFHHHCVEIVIFYTEILTRKVVLWCFFSSETSEKIHNSTFQVKISV